MNAQDFKPINEDILIERVDPSKYTTTSSLILDFKDIDMDLTFFRVVRKSDKVKDVNEGDIVLVSWERVTPPIDLDGDRYGITSVKEIMGVIDDY